MLMFALLPVHIFISPLHGGLPVAAPRTMVPSPMNNFNTEYVGAQWRM